VGPGQALKVAAFTVHASMAQSIAWKRAAEAEGFASVGSWASLALDAYLKARARAGRPLPLLRSHAQARELASELAPLLLRNELPDPAPIIDRHQRESV